MKKIPLEVYDFAGGLRVMAHFLFKSKVPHAFGIIEAVVDTGSPTTLIGPKDLARLRVSKIQLDRIDGRKDPLNYGGGESKGKVIEDVEISIGEYLKTKMPVKVIIESSNEAAQISLIGVDFMIHNKCSLFFNPIKKEAYFEIEEPQNAGESRV